MSSVANRVVVRAATVVILTAHGAGERAAAPREAVVSKGEDTAAGGA